MLYWVKYVTQRRNIVWPPLHVDSQRKGYKWTYLKWLSKLSSLWMTVDFADKIDCQSRNSMLLGDIKTGYICILVLKIHIHFMDLKPSIVSMRGMAWEGQRWIIHSIIFTEHLLCAGQRQGLGLQGWRSQMAPHGAYVIVRETRGKQVNKKLLLAISVMKSHTNVVVVGCTWGVQANFSSDAFGVSLEGRWRN